MRMTQKETEAVIASLAIELQNEFGLVNLATRHPGYIYHSGYLLYYLFDKPDETFRREISRRVRELLDKQTWARLGGENFPNKYTLHW